jgi:predicted phosphodiesterase
MKLWILNDTHIGVRGNHPLFLSEVERVFDLLCSKVSAEDWVMILGDVFDSRTAINLRAMKTAKKIFSKLSKKVSKIIISLGNHDIHYTNTLEPNSIEPLLEYFQNLEIVTETKVFDFLGKKIMVVPWLVPSAVNQFLIDVNTTSADFCFGHFDIQGFKFNRHTVNDKHGFKKEVFAKFDMVLSGHYHIASESDNIKYLGTQYQMTWDDFEEKKFIHFIDESLSLQKLESGRDLFLRLKIGEEVDVRDCYCKLIVESSVSTNTISAEVERLLKLGATDVRVVQQFTHDLSVDSSKISSIMSSEISLKDVIKNIAKEQSIDASYDQSMIKTMLDGILDEAFEATDA